MEKTFVPKLFSQIRDGIKKEQVYSDIISGIIVGIVALPLAVAFAIASGVSPEKGILTAIIAGFLISLLGGSRVQIGGPTGAFIVIVYSIIEKHGLNGLLIATFMAGFILVLMGLFKLGAILKYIPQTLIIGFTTGIAVLIFSTQIKDLLGLQITDMPSEFHLKWLAILENLKTINLWSLLIGAMTIIIIVVLPKISEKFKKIPWTFVALIITSIPVFLFKLPVDTIFSRFGNISNVLPAPVLFKLDLNLILNLMLPAISIATLGALESLLSAVVADSMIGGRHRSNMELVAQGIANIITPLFGGIPATGAIARTATNIRNGARTPIAGIVHALTLLVIYLFAMPVVKYIPMATLAGILIVVAWNMSEMHVFIQNLKITIHESIVLLLTFLLTVFMDLTIAIPAGFVMATILFMKRMSDSVEFSPIMSVKRDEESLFHEEIGEYSDKILIFEINGPLFFGSAQMYMEIEKNMNIKHSVIILRFRYVPIIDSSGLHKLKDIIKRLSKENVKLIISGANSKVQQTLIRHCSLNQEDFKADIREAVKAAEQIK